MRYATHHEEGKKVWFNKSGLRLAGLLFLPDGFSEEKRYPAVVVTHPGGGVKEQCPSLYAWHLARAGYVALAFDTAHQGESEGLPRCLEDPASRVEDIRAAVDHLVSLPFVDEERIGAMGICAGGGYTMSAIQTEARIRAAAGISTWDVGDSARNGFPGVEVEDFMHGLLAEVARARTAEARGGMPSFWKYVPDSPDEMDEHTSVIQREAYEYYRTPRCGHPRSVNRCLVSSNDKLAAFDAFAHLHTVAPRPLLFIVGSRADTLYFTEDACRRAREAVSVHVVQGASHVDLYDKPEYVADAVAALTDFFGVALQEA